MLRHGYRRIIRRDSSMQAAIDELYSPQAGMSSRSRPGLSQRFEGREPNIGGYYALLAQI
jgi:hypothetical protein